MTALTFFPTGNADTTLIRLADDRLVFVDYANTRNLADRFDTRGDLPAELRKEMALARRTDFSVVCFTHIDDDHVLGAGDFFWLRQADKYKVARRPKIDELWVPPGAITETSLTDDARIVRQEARFRLLDGSGIKVFSRPGALRSFLEENGLTLEDRSSCIVDAGRVVPGLSTLGSESAEFFVHCPFAWRTDERGLENRNQDSIVMQAAFVEGGQETFALLVSDVNHETLTEIVKTSKRHGNEHRLRWDVMKLFHHCSYTALGPERGVYETEAVDEVQWLFETQSRDGCSSSRRVGRSRQGEQGGRGRATSPPPGRRPPSPRAEQAERRIPCHHGDPERHEAEAFPHRRHRGGLSLRARPHHLPRRGCGRRAEGGLTCIRGWRAGARRSRRTSCRRRWRAGSSDTSPRAATDWPRSSAPGASMRPRCLVLAVGTGRPQSPAHAILRIERVAVLFTPGDAPRVLALRRDFPETPHQTLMPAELPCGLCIDDRPWADARLTYTPAELLERITSWFRKAGRGELHGAGQPLDPLFVGCGLEVVVPRSAWGGQDAELVGFLPVDTTRPRHIIAKPLAEVPAGQARPEARLVVLAYDLGAQPMSRLRFAPVSLEGLHADGRPRPRPRRWPDQAHRGLACARGRRRRPPPVAPAAPVQDPDRRSGNLETSTIAFLSSATIGEVGERLGILLANEDSGPGAAPYLKRLVAAPPELDGIALQDTFLPHNLARHTFATADVGRGKAAALADRLRRIRPDLAAIAIDADALGGRGEQLARSCGDADVVIDASASVCVARRISDLQGAARRLSIFFNPSGTAVVLLVEDAARTCDLRGLEAAYHREVQRNASLGDHMAVAGMLRYTGACRSLTSRMPASRARALSGIVAHGLRKALDGKDAVVRVWTMDDAGGVRTAAAPTSCALRVLGLDGGRTGRPCSLARRTGCQPPAR